MIAEHYVRRAQPDEAAAVLGLYRDYDYGGGVDPSDIILMARTNAGIMGAVRVCSEQGTVVLRGMQVRAEYRGQGIGFNINTDYDTHGC